MKKLLSITAAAYFLTSVMSAAPIYYFTRLTGAKEFPANGSTATGTGEVIYDPATHLMRVIVRFDGLTTGNTASHIHCCVATPFDTTLTAGVATPTPTFPGFPSGTTSGFYDQTFDMTLGSSYRNGFVTLNGSVAASETALANGLANGTSYLNIHTSLNPGGEIRGFLQLAPEPSSYAMMGSALAGLFLLRRRRLQQ